MFMEQYQGDELLGDTEAGIGVDRSWIEDTSKQWDVVKLSYGDNIDVEARTATFKKYQDYDSNQRYYDAWADTDVWHRNAGADANNRIVHENAILNSKFKLDENGNVVNGEGATPISKYLYDLDAIKGGLLAQANGYTKDIESQEYANLTKEKSQNLAAELKGSSTSSMIAGIVLGHGSRAETVMEIAASPAKIMGSTLWKGVGKAFVTEFAVGLMGETLREQQIKTHMENADLDYTLWDSVQNIFIGAGLAGSIRGIGSAAVDMRTLQKISKKDSTQLLKNMRVEAGAKTSDITGLNKEILERYFRREQMKLTTDSRANIELLHKVQDDIDNGKSADIEDFTDIPMETKVADDLEANSLPDEVALEHQGRNTVEQINEIQKQVDEVPVWKEATIEDPYGGMVEPKVADEIVGEQAAKRPEIQAELDEIKRLEEEYAAEKMTPEQQAVLDRMDEGIDEKLLDYDDAEFDALTTEQKQQRIMKRYDEMGIEVDDTPAVAPVVTPKSKTPDHIKQRNIEIAEAAEDIITDGNSIHEQGYDPKGDN